MIRRSNWKGERYSWMVEEQESEVVEHLSHVKAATHGGSSL